MIIFSQMSKKELDSAIQLQRQKLGAIKAVCNSFAWHPELDPNYKMVRRRLYRMISARAELK